MVGEGKIFSFPESQTLVADSRSLSRFQLQKRDQAFSVKRLGVQTPDSTISELVDLEMVREIL